MPVEAHTNNAPSVEDVYGATGVRAARCARSAGTSVSVGAGVFGVGRGVL